jgi:hypothetical protein
VPLVQSLEGPILQSIKYLLPESCAQENLH